MNLVDSIRSFALPPTMRMHMRRVPIETKAIEPIIQSMYVPSFVWRFSHFPFSNKYSEYSESGNGLIFWISYNTLASMRTHMNRIPYKIKAIEPIIQSMYVPSFGWRFVHLLFSKKYSKYSESGNALIFWIFYDLLASTNWFLEGDSLHKGRNTEGNSLHSRIIYCF